MRFLGWNGVAEILLLEIPLSELMVAKAVPVTEAEDKVRTDSASGAFGLGVEGDEKCCVIC